MRNITESVNRFLKKRRPPINKYGWLANTGKLLRITLPLIAVFVLAIALSVSPPVSATQGQEASAGIQIIKTQNNMVWSDIVLETEQGFDIDLDMDSIETSSSGKWIKINGTFSTNFLENETANTTGTKYFGFSTDETLSGGYLCYRDRGSSDTPTCKYKSDFSEYQGTKHGFEHIYYTSWENIPDNLDKEFQLKVECDSCDGYPTSALIYFGSGSSTMTISEGSGGGVWVIDTGYFEINISDDGGCMGGHDEGTGLTIIDDSTNAPQDQRVPFEFLSTQSGHMAVYYPANSSQVFHNERSSAEVTCWEYSKGYCNSGGPPGICAYLLRCDRTDHGWEWNLTWAIFSDSPAFMVDLLGPDSATKYSWMTTNLNALYQNKALYGDTSFDASPVNDVTSAEHFVALGKTGAVGNYSIGLSWQDYDNSENDKNLTDEGILAKVMLGVWHPTEPSLNWLTGHGVVWTYIPSTRNMPEAQQIANATQFFNATRKEPYSTSLSNKVLTVTPQFPIPEWTPIMVDLSDLGCGTDNITSVSGLSNNGYWTNFTNVTGQNVFVVVDNITISSQAQYTVTCGGDASESGGDTAIEAGIDSALNDSASIYTDQQVYARNLTGSQDLGTFDKVAVYGDQRWAFNYVTDGESTTDLFEIRPVLFIKEFANQESNNITTIVEDYIIETLS